MTITLQRILDHFFGTKGKYSYRDDLVISNETFSELSYQGCAIAVMRIIDNDDCILKISTRSCPTKAVLSRLNAIINKFYISVCYAHEPVRWEDTGNSLLLFGKPWNGLWAQMKWSKPNKWEYVK